jgi:hypothetical protein
MTIPASAGARADAPTAVPPLRLTSAMQHRTRPWWLLPTTVVAVLTSFVGYSAWVATIGTGDAANAPFLSPFYSPRWLAGHFPVFPAFFCLLVPIAFRSSCYYYRKAYHRSYLWDPPACAVAELRRRPYRGETAAPLVLNNLHRFAMYAAVVYIVILGYDAANAVRYGGHWYLGIGTLLMWLNVVLLAGYTFGCHSVRHCVGGGLDCYSSSALRRRRHGLWRLITKLNVHHALWAWVSLISVAGVDVYIRMLNAGWFLDPHHRF